MKKLLVVEDEKKIREVIASYFQREGFEIFEAESGSEALDLVNKSAFDCIILDLMLPDLSGEEVCKAIRRTSAAPIIMLTAKTQEGDRINGLAIGADDYVLKPFSPRELVMRVKTILRRSSDDSLLAETVSFNNEELVIYAGEQAVFVRGRKISMTPSEYKLLLVLVKYPKRVYTREELVEKVLGFDFEGEIRIIDQHIKNLRQKIEFNPKEPLYIETVFGVGYKFAGERLA